MDLKLALQLVAKSLNSAMDELVPETADAESRLLAAMRYSLLNGGKRLRPFLVVSGARLFGVQERSALRVAAAVEMIHTYSLIHDDLPAMDDDDLRRGRASNHKQFDDATAILAGDALQARAFDILAAEDTHTDPSVRCRLVAELAKASGPYGLVGGQMIDLQAEQWVRADSVDMGLVTRLQAMKTGALIRFSCIAGAILGKADATQRHALSNYSHDIGLAFQIADDILDVEGESDRMGKTAGKDMKQGKATIVALLGVDAARKHAELLIDQAVNHLSVFDQSADFLRAVARYIMNRNT